MTDKTNPTGLALLRDPFPAHQISKLPKPTAKETQIVKDDFSKGIRCEVCGAWHHPKVIHLDYVGHAALTDRLLDADPAWDWEPLAMSPAGLPVMDGNGGMWIKLTVCGVTRLGYGHPDSKTGGNAVKEVIGDALRNAAMRFGAALDLWHKGDLHGDNDGPGTESPKSEAPPAFDPIAAHDRIARKLEAVTSLADLADAWKSESGTIKEVTDARADLGKTLTDTKDRLKAELAPKGYAQ
jgi:hypothetical protein